MAAMSPVWADIARASPPASRIRPSTPSRSACLRLASTTLAPAPAYATAIAAPIPRDAPVTNATLPDRSNICCIFMGRYPPHGLQKTIQCLVTHKTQAFLPLTSGRGVDVRRDPHALIHGHVGERLAQDPIVDGPGPQSNAIRGPRGAKRIRIIQLLKERASFFAPG